MLGQPDIVRLKHMRDAAGKAIRISRGKSRADLEAPAEPLPDALIHLLSVIGEAANRVGVEARRDLSAIRWSEIIGMRNRLIHAYFDIDLDILWATVQEDLPPLIKALDEILAGLEAT